METKNLFQFQKVSLVKKEKFNSNTLPCMMVHQFWNLYKGLMLPNAHYSVRPNCTGFCQQMALVCGPDIVGN